MPSCPSSSHMLAKSMYAALSSIFTYSWRLCSAASAVDGGQRDGAVQRERGTRSDPASYRPISMTSIIIRTFEHLIHKRLSELLEKASFFHPLQFGFRKNHSTLDAINYLQYNTRTHYVRRRATVSLLCSSTSRRRLTVCGTRNYCRRVERAGRDRPRRGGGCTLSCVVGAFALWTATTNRSGVAWSTVYHRVQYSALCCSTSSSTSLAKRHIHSLSIPQLSSFMRTTSPSSLVLMPLVNGRRRKNQRRSTAGPTLYTTSTSLTAFRILDDWCTEHSYEVRRGQDGVGGVRQEPAKARSTLRSTNS